MRVVQLALLCMTLALAGCSDHVVIPPSKMSYVGIWSDDGTMYLEIAPDGKVNYVRTDKENHTKVTLHDVPLKEFVGKDFEVGWGWFSTTFHVRKPPYREDGQWRMVVDGVTLTREGDCPACPVISPEDSNDQQPVFRGGQRI